MEVAGAGFINIWLNKEFVCSKIKSIVLEGCKPPKLEKKLKVVVDFSAPNIAKEMHVGHLRFVEKILFLVMKQIAIHGIFFFFFFLKISYNRGQYFKFIGISRSRCTSFESRW